MRTRKALSFVLALALAVSLLPVVAFAAVGDYTVTAAATNFSAAASGTWGFTSNDQTVAPVSRTAKDNDWRLKFSVNAGRSTASSYRGGPFSATKTFDAPIDGDKLMVNFDWWPGQTDYVYREGSYGHYGELRLLDAKGKQIFTLVTSIDEAASAAAGALKSHPLGFFVGNGGGSTSAGVDLTYLPAEFSNVHMWYSVTIELDFVNNTAKLTIGDLMEEYQPFVTTVSLANADFNGQLGGMSLVACRPGGDGAVWEETWLDNIFVYTDPIPATTVLKTEEYTFKTVAVDSAATIAAIGLPTTVKGTLQNGAAVNLPIDANTWTSSPAWDPAVAGMYLLSADVLSDGTATLTRAATKTAHVWVNNSLTAEDKNAVPRKTERLDRGLIALKADTGIFVSWRLLATEYATAISFNLYKNDEADPLNGATPITSKTNWLDATGVPGDVYRLETTDGPLVKDTLATALSTNYMEIALQRPAAGLTAAGVARTYSVTDTIPADLDGDGRYELVVKWMPAGAIDSGVNGSLTAPTVFDAYTLDGKLLWRIDMGINVTSGEHYNEILVYDFDGNGKAEVALKTADGTKTTKAVDGVLDAATTAVIGNAAADFALRTNSTKNNSANRVGHMSEAAPEFFTFFAGDTGAIIDTAPWKFPLVKPEYWGDLDYNRSDRYLASSIYLPDPDSTDGTGHYAAVMIRGYYERTTLTAYTLVDGQIEIQWAYDSKAADIAGPGDAYVQDRGAHATAVADVDNDGWDEIVFGSTVFDHDGTVLNTSSGLEGRPNLSHGDALHVGQFAPDIDSIMVFMPHEEYQDRSANATLRDAATGEMLFGHFASSGDNGRGVCANILPSAGFEFWSAAGGGVHDVYGNLIQAGVGGTSNNFALLWDGNLEQELMNGSTLSITSHAFNGSAITSTTIATLGASHGGSKQVPGIQADILGDWREEVITAVSGSGNENLIRLYSTTTPTDYMIYSLMHDGAYRMQVVGQNATYNQPPHLSFYLGSDIEDDVLDMKLPIPNVVYTTVNKDLLKQYIDEANGLDEDDWTEESWDHLQEVLEEAQAVYDDPNATQEEVDEAAQKLRDAIDALVPRPVQATILKLKTLYYTMKKGSSYILLADYDGAPGTLKWTSSDPSIVQVVNENTGEIKALKTGSVILNVRSTDGSGLSANVTILVRLS